LSGIYWQRHFLLHLTTTSTTKQNPYDGSGQQDELLQQSLLHTTNLLCIDQGRIWRGGRGLEPLPMHPMKPSKASQTIFSHGWGGRRRKWEKVGRRREIKPP
jgi:hypothetical protein